MSFPVIIQGGMGIGLSNWTLANAVASLGQMGVVSGTGLHIVFARRLQQGDIGGHLRRAIARFPVPAMARRVLDRYFVPGGRTGDKPFAPLRLFTSEPDPELVETAIVANFVEVTLAKEGHDGLIGVNLLEKAQLGNLSALYGAMLAGVDYVLMGAGIPREIPGTLDRLALHEPVTLRLEVAGATPEDSYRIGLDPQAIMGCELLPLKRPQFLAIISSATLAVTLTRKSNGTVNGFVVEGPTAGGHNAPPRGALQLDGDGAPIYGGRDVVDLEAIRALGLPFWLAGSYGTPEKLQDALDHGAAGIQVGTAFAFCRESGLDPGIKEKVNSQILRGDTEVFTDPLASPTGFPFKVLSLPDTISEAAVYEARRRVCDIGVLRRPYKQEDGTLGYRCSAEPVNTYVRKGGRAEDAAGRKCICNGLLSNIGLGHKEAALVTAGDELKSLSNLIDPDSLSYSARDVVEHLLGRSTPWEQMST